MLSQNDAQRWSKTNAVNLPRDEAILGQLSDVVQGTLDTIEDSVHDTGTQLDRQSLVLADDGVSHSQSTGVLIDLNGSSVALQANDLSHQLVVADADQLEHCRSGHALGNNNWVI